MDVDDRETAIPGELHKPLLCKDVLDSAGRVGCI